MRLSSITYLVIAGLGFITGCGQANSMSGTVTYNGEPVESGEIAFDSADGSGPGFGAQVLNGQYTTDKVRLGPHVARVRGLTAAPTLTKEESIKLREQRANKHGLPVDYIAEDAEGNSRAVEIEAGAQTMDFALKGTPRPK